MMWVVVGLLAGWVAGYVMKEGGYGLRGDLILGVAGSIVGGWLFSVLRISPDAGLVALIIIAFIGGTAAIFAQHRFWAMHA
ncbi:MAG: GlsB/YeaQ/YmgE family stress response membrane protein [Zetaproteobacteria bacterium]|nr:MAG: GlsB/YeaQ/YmgE family stress response membrane protein [Zetaproteobacteria bacterium]